MVASNRPAPAKVSIGAETRRRERRDLPGSERTPSLYNPRIYAALPWSRALRGSWPARPARRCLLSGSCSRTSSFAPRFLPALGHPPAAALRFVRGDQLTTGLSAARVRPCWAHMKKAARGRPFHNRGDPITSSSHQQPCQQCPWRHQRPCRRLLWQRQQPCQQRPWQRQQPCHQQQKPSPLPNWPSPLLRRQRCRQRRLRPRRLQPPWERQQPRRQQRQQELLPSCRKRPEQQRRRWKRAEASWSCESSVSLGSNNYGLLWAIVGTLTCAEPQRSQAKPAKAGTFASLRL
jgi:hypothetical protein